MNLKYILYGFVALFIIVAFLLITRTFLSCSETSGIVNKVSITEHNDILFTLEDGRDFYINRGVETELNVKWLLDSLPSKNIQLCIQNKSTHISKMYYKDSCIYQD